MDIELIKIFNKVQVLSSNKEYIYNKMECINSKPVLQAGNENLLEYRVLLQLHCRVSNPKKIIETIENYAAKREPFDWIYNGKYMGEFVIDNVEKNIKKQEQDLIVYAELTVNLLENPTNKDFQEQMPGDADLSQYVQYYETSNIFKDFEKEIQKKVVENIKNNIINTTITDNISATSQNFVNTVSCKILDEISEGNITDIFDTVAGYKKIIDNSDSLILSEKEKITNIINKIPEKMLDASVRSG